MVLRPGIELDDLTKIIKEDFDNDCLDKNETDEKNQEGQIPKQNDTLTVQKMYDAVFELVDTWCPNVDESEYTGFIKGLQHKLKYEGQQDGSAYNLIQWSSL